MGAIREGVALFSGGLANACSLADLKLGRLLDRFDAWEQRGGAGVPESSHRLEPTRVAATPTLELDLRRRDIRTVVWASGFRPDHSWLAVPVLDHRGQIRHAGGVVPAAPGMYTLGGNLLRTRRSSYIAGAKDDTEALVTHLRDYLAGRTRSRRSTRPHDLHAV